MSEAYICLDKVVVMGVNLTFIAALPVTQYHTIAYIGRVVA
jgi:hypothetical protein